MALNKIAMAKSLVLSGMSPLMELSEAEIGGALLGAFVAYRYMRKEEVEDWIEFIDKKLFYQLGGLEGIRKISDGIAKPFWYYFKAQAIFVCVYKRIWGAKTFIRVEENRKIPEKTEKGICTLFEAPECLDWDKCMDMTTFLDR